MKPTPAFYVLVRYRLTDATGPFRSAEEAEEFRLSLVQPKGWHVVGVASPRLPVSMLQARLEANPPEREDH